MDSDIPAGDGKITNLFYNAVYTLYTFSISAALWPGLCRAKPGPISTGDSYLLLYISVDIPYLRVERLSSKLISAGLIAAI